MSTVKSANFQHPNATNPAIVLAADGSATANVSAINGGPLAGFRNAIINGNFDIWQRGTSFTSTTALYGADRWQNNVIGTGATMSRQAFTPGQTDVPGEPTYFCRMAVTSAAGAGNFATLQQRIEGVRTFAGQQVTVSFWAKADASKPIAVELTQSFGDGGSPSAGVSGIGTTKTTLSTSWQKITVTTTVTSISGKTLGTDGSDRLQLNLWFDAGSDFNARTDSLGHQSGTFDIAQVQLESGPVATPFERRPIGTELALCQRYFQTGQVYIRGYAVTSGGVIDHTYTWPTTMRAAPSVTWSGSPTRGNSTEILTQSVRAENLQMRLVASAAGDSFSLGDVYSATAEL